MTRHKEPSFPDLVQITGTFRNFFKTLEKNPFLKSLAEKMAPEKRFSLGLDVGTHALRYVLLDPSTAQILKWGSVVLAAPRSETGNGKKEVRTLPATLKDIGKHLPKARIRQTALNLQDLSVVTGNFNLPAPSGKDPRLIRMTIGDQLSFPIEDAAYIYSEHKLAAPGRMIFNFAAVPRKIVEKLIDPVDEAFALVPDVSLQGHALESLIRTLNLSAPGEVLAFLNVGRSTTIVSIFQDSDLVFERHIPLCVQDLTRAIFIMYLEGISPRTAQDLEEAEKVKKESHLPLPALTGKKAASSSRAPQGSLLSEDENRKLFKVIDGLLAAWVQDIRLSFNFFNENYAPQHVSRIYLIGGGSNLKNFDSYLSSELGIETLLLSFPKESGISISSLEPAEEFKGGLHEYATALALALKPEGYATLTPKEYKTLAAEQLAHSILRTGSILLFAFLLVWLIFLSVQNRHLNEIRSNFLKNYGLMQQAEGPYLAMTRWEEFLKTVETSAPKAAAVLKVLSQRIPSNILLSRIVLQRERGTLLLEGVVTGDAKGCAVTLSEFSKSLEDSGYFKKTEMPSLERNVAQPGSALFDLTAVLTAFPEGTQ